MACNPPEETPEVEAAPVDGTAQYTIETLASVDESLALDLQDRGI